MAGKAAFAWVLVVVLGGIVAGAYGDDGSRSPFWEPWMVDPDYPTIRLRSADGPFAVADPGSATDVLTPADLDQMKSDLAFLMGIEDLFAVPIENRPPLNPVVTGWIQRDGYVVYKLYFESLPGFPVSANLYVPDDPAFPLPRPAILCPHGHWENPQAKFSNEVQVRSIGLVKLGYTVLAYDALGSGERAGPNNVDEGHEALSAAQSWPGGPLPTGIMAYEASRAVDYLLTRPDVADMTHPAITGASGGATQTINGTIFDDRIEVAVPVAWGGYAHPHPFGTGDENIPLLSLYMKRASVTALIYPAKALFLSESEWPLWLVEDALDTYDALGHADWIAHVSADAPHDYSRPYRERMYAWMSRWVLGVEAGDTIPDPEGVSDEMAIEDSSDLTVGLPEGRLFYVDICAAFRSLLPAYALPVSESEWADRWDAIESGLMGQFAWPAQFPDIVIDPDPPSGNPEVFRIRPEDLVAELNVSGEQYLWESWLDAELYKPSTAGPWPCVVITNPDEFPRNDWEYEDSYEAIDDSARIQGLVEDGYAVLKVRPRFNDEPADLVPGNTGYQYELAVTRLVNWEGAPLFGRHVFDLNRVLDYLETRSDIDPTRITLWGMGEGGPISAAAAALDDRVCQCVVERSRLSFGIVANFRHPGWSYPPRAFEVADFGQLATLITPRRFIVADAVDDGRAQLPLVQAQAALAWPIASYAAFGASGELRILGGTASADPASSFDPLCAPDVETGIVLKTFAAELDGADVRLFWETVEERETAGFHLWRSDDDGETYVRITDDLIPGEGEPMNGASYDWFDVNPLSGTYLYQLEDVDIYGVGTRHGPVVILVPEVEPSCGLGGASGSLPCALAVLAGLFLVVRRKRRRLGS